MSARPHRNLQIATVQAVVAELAHDLNQPAAALSLLFEAAGMRARRGSVVEEVTDALRASEDQVDRLVGSMRRFSQTAREALLEPAPDGATIRTAVAAAADASGIRGLGSVRLIEDVPDTASSLASEIEVITLALLLNCAEAPDPSEVRIEARPAGTENLELVVSNDGPPIPSLDTLCEPFFTTKTHHLGLGLFVCRRLALVNGGDLRLEAPPSGGLRVCVEI